MVALRRHLAATMGTGSSDDCDVSRVCAHVTLLWPQRAGRRACREEPASKQTLCVGGEKALQR